MCIVTCKRRRHVLDPWPFNSTKPNASHGSHVPVALTGKKVILLEIFLFWSNNLHHSCSEKNTIYLRTYPPLPPRPLSPTHLTMIPSPLLKEWTASAISTSAFPFAIINRNLSYFVHFTTCRLREISVYHTVLNRRASINRHFSFFPLYSWVKINFFTMQIKNLVSLPSRTGRHLQRYNQGCRLVVGYAFLLSFSSRFCFLFFLIDCLNWKPVALEFWFLFFIFYIHVFCRLIFSFLLQILQMYSVQNQEN